MLQDILISNNVVTLDTFTCNICLKSTFPSRNKLYKHIKICQVNHDIIKQNECMDEKHDYDEFYLYVVGGRIRGKTLHTVERFSFHKQQWEDCIPMLENRGSHGAASLNNILYVIGGGGMNSNLSSCEAYNGINWYEIAPLQVSRHALAVINAGSNSIYAIGGWVDGKECSNMIERYDPSLNQWKSVGTLLLARRLHGVASYKSYSSLLSLSTTISNNHNIPNTYENNNDYRQYKIYVFGGHCNDPYWQTNTAEVYDPLTNTCSSIQSMPVAGGTSAIAISSYIYVFVHGKYVLRYDPNLDQYIRLSDLPLKEWHCFDVSVINVKQQYTYIYVYGGITNGKWLKPLYRYCIITDTWKEMPSMKSARRRCASAIVYHTAVSQKVTTTTNSNNNSDFNISIEESAKKPKL